MAPSQTRLCSGFLGLWAHWDFWNDVSSGQQHLIEPEPVGLDRVLLTEMDLVEASLARTHLTEAHLNEPRLSRM